jgi:PQQ-dependent dehydrogenase (methanol/ethanol family)
MQPAYSEKHGDFTVPTHASTKQNFRGVHLFSLFFLSCFIAGVAARGATAESNDNTYWPFIGSTSAAQQYSPLRQINENNIQHLGLAWYVDIPSADGLVGNTVVAGNTIYEAGPGSKIYAHDARSGRQLWIFDPKPQFIGTILTFWGNQITRGLAMWKDNLYVATGDCRVVAINRLTGKQLWEAKSCEPAESYTITGAPRVGGGKVFIGNSSIDAASNRGFVDAFDAETGRHLWRFYTVPGDPSKESASKAMTIAAKTWGKDWKNIGGGNAWDGMTFDPVLNLLYIGTGGPQPQNPLQRSVPGGDALFTDSIVALNADTGEYVWHYQTTPDDAWDFDAMAPILVADVSIKGESRRVVMQAPKNGFFYVLDAKTGKLLSADNFVPVNWASKIDLKSGRPIENPIARYYENKDGRATVVPNEHGAHNWQAMSYSPQTGLVYIPAMLNAGIYQSTYPPGGVKVDLGAGKSEVKSKTSGQLVAWDPVAQKPRWRSDLDLPINGGVLSTAGELVFQGTATGEFFAYQAQTGKRVWTWYTGSATQAAPSTVMIDGEQLVLLPVGAGGAQQQVFADWTSTKKSRGPVRLLAFKLGGSAQLPAYQYSEYFPRPPRPRYPADEVSKGAALFDDSGCSFCHGYQAIHPTGRVPDLRKASKEVHDSLAAIVLGGARTSKGMPSFAGAVTPEQLEAIQAYIIDEAWNAYEKQEHDKNKPGD